MLRYFFGMVFGQTITQRFAAEMQHEVPQKFAALRNIFKIFQ